MQLSIVIPCYNEFETLERLLRAVRNGPIKDIEIIVVDDASTDGSRELLAGALADLVDKTLFHEMNRGKGAALRTGFRAAEGEYVVVQDADLEYNPAELPRLLEPLLTGQADAVFGSRFAAGQQRRAGYLCHSLANRFLTALSNRCTGLGLTDMETCYKMIRREVLQRVVIEENRFGFEPEITAKLARLGCVVREVSISYQGRSFAEKKKIGWRDGFRAVYAIFKYQHFHSLRGEPVGREVLRAGATRQTRPRATGATAADPGMFASATSGRAA